MSWFTKKPVMIGVCGNCFRAVRDRMDGIGPRCDGCGAMPDPLKMRERRQDAIKRDADTRLREEIARVSKARR